METTTEREKIATWTDGYTLVDVITGALHDYTHHANFGICGDCHRAGTDYPLQMCAEGQVLFSRLLLLEQQHKSMFGGR